MKDIKFFSNEIEQIECEIKSILGKIDSKETLCEELSNFGYNYQFLFSNDLDNNSKSIDSIFKNDKQKSKYTGIYLFEPLNHHMSEKNWDSYKNHMKEKSPEDKVPKWNKGSDDSFFFYIGKSNDLKKRIKEHTDTASPSTYALKLKEFKQCFSDFEYKVHIFYPKDLDQKNSSISNYRAINELVESVLHDSLKPMIGNK